MNKLIDAKTLAKVSRAQQERCPHCESALIGYGVTNPKSYTRQGTCLACKKTWTEYRQTTRVD